jgi:hypothetical protein
LRYDITTQSKYFSRNTLGQGQAIFIVDYGMHQNSCWIVAINDNGIVKHFDSNDVIISTNHTYYINMKKNCNYIEDSKG